MQVAKGLERIHRWKKELKLHHKEIAALEKKLAGAKESASTWEVGMIEKKLFSAQEALSITEKNLKDSWT
jgi:hypothetical protein